MPPKTLALILTILAVVVVVAGVGWAIFNSVHRAPAPSLSFSPSPSPTQATTPNPTVSATSSLTDTIEPTAVPASQSQIRDLVLTFIMTNHNETAPQMHNFIWTGGRVDTGLVGSETYQYMSNGWNVTMQYPVVLNPIYTVTVEYISLISEVMPQKPIANWQGTWQNGTIVETSYKFTP